MLYLSYFVLSLKNSNNYSMALKVCILIFSVTSSDQSHIDLVYNNTNYKYVKEIVSPDGWDWSYGPTNQSEITYVNVREASESLSN